jgi:hypothetical protein
VYIGLTKGKTESSAVRQRNPRMFEQLKEVKTAGKRGEVILEDKAPVSITNRL